jgi:1-acyl-sn-glycerol-3-phosphate acyltransferase
VRFPRTYRLVRWLARTGLRSQYRRVEVEGAEHVPTAGPVLLVANHFSALVDSMAILHASPRPVSFLAKAPLWRSGLLRPFLDALGAVPVYRPQDVPENEGRGVRANVEKFAVCRDRLAQGACLAIFPEGVSQPQPRLMPVRTGAARIVADVPVPVSVVPVGLVYDHPTAERRGTLLVRFGVPFPSRRAGAGPRRAEIASLTRTIEASLRLLLAEADSQADLAALRTLRTVFDQERGHPPPRTLAEEHRRNRRFARWLAGLAAEAPGEVQALRAATDAYARSLDLAGLTPALVRLRFDRRRVVRFLARELPVALVVGPLALAAAVVTWPLRRLGDVIALRAFGGAEDVRAMCRMAGVGLVTVLAAALGAVVAGVLAGPLAALATVVGLPALLALHVAWRDHRADVAGRVRAFFLLTGGHLARSLRDQRRALHERMLAYRKESDSVR